MRLAISFLDRFKKKPERTPGGSEIIRSTPKPPQEMIGIPEIDTTPFALLRERVYSEFFGPYETVSHEIIHMLPHIDVYIHVPTNTRSFYTLVSGGMSDMPMQIPPTIDQSYTRREIVLYCDTPDEAYIRLVRHFARFPFQNATWLGHGHTIPNGDPAEPLFENSTLNSVLFISTIVRPDNQLGSSVTIADTPVQLLWLVPITQAELDYKLQYGVNALLDKFDQYNHPVVLQRTRASYV